MSSTNRGANRDGLDRYYTPGTFARACVSRLSIPAGARVLEPSCGAGAFLRAVDALESGAVLHACDLDPFAPGLPLVNVRRQWCGDFLAFNPADPFDLVLGNPPYNQAEAHVRHALTMGHTVAFLLRLAFLESKRRADLWRSTPLRAVHVLAQRPSFTGGATDSAAYAFMVWEQGYTGAPEMGWIWPEEVRRG